MEKAVVSALLRDAAALPEIAEIVTPVDFLHIGLRTVFAAMLRVEPIDLLTIADELERSGELAKAGGYAFLSDVAGYESTAANVRHHAQRVRRYALEREAKTILRRIEENGQEARLVEDLRAKQEEIDALQAGGQALSDLGFTGARLAKLRERVRPDSMLPELLDREPGVHLLTGRPKTAKTRLALWLALCFAMGRRPWSDAPDLPRSYVTILSAEQPTIRIDQVMRQVGLFIPGGSDLASWTENTTILGRDSELVSRARRLMCLDATARSMLRAALQRDRERGRPCKLLVLDSLSRLAPPGFDENAAGEATAFLQPLQELAEDLGLWILLIHHQGHASDAHRTDAVGAGRGSSAIAAVPPVVWNVQKVPGEPRQRVLHVAGNDVPGSTIHFEVAPESAAEDHVLYFRHIDPTDALIGRWREWILPGDRLSQTQIAWRIQGEEPTHAKDKPHGRAYASAKKLADYLHRTGSGGCRVEYVGQTRWITRPAVAPAMEPDSA